MTPQSPAPRFIDMPETCRITSQRKTSIYNLINAGELRPIKLGRKTVFLESEIFAWVNQRVAARNAKDRTTEKTATTATVAASEKGCGK